MNVKNQIQLKKPFLDLAKKSTLWFFFTALLFKIVLDISYCFIISPNYEYMRLYLNIDIFKIIESYFLLFVIFLLMPKSSKKLSSIIVWLLILLSYIPMLTIYAFMNESRIFTYAVTLFWMLVFLLLQLPSISLPSFKQNKIFLFSMLFLSGITVFFMIYKYVGISFNFNIFNVYDIRSQFTEKNIFLSGYLFTWQGYILNPVFFAYFIRRKQWIYATVILVFQLLLFSVTGMKTFLFIIPFILALMWLITRKNPLVYTAIGLIVLILLGMLSYALIDDIYVSSIFTRRIFFVPAQISFLYYDFFSHHAFVFLSHSIFRYFLDYPYHLYPPNLIGKTYFNSPKMHSNTGIVGDAYSNFGFVGLALWAILLAIVLKLVDSCSKRKDKKVAIAAIAMPVIALLNSALLTNLLTHGFLLAILILYLLPNIEEQ